MGRLSRLVEVIGWYEKGSAVAERKLLRKVDFFVLSFLCLQLFVNYLDRTNFTNAYVSGMREALHFEGKQFNNANACFAAGYAIGQIPQNLLLLVVPPRILFPLNSVIFGGLSLVSAAARTVPQMYAIKFFQGFAEASTFVGAHYIFGAWYKRSEICKRAAIFSSSAQAATIFSGVLQSALYTNLNGVGGLLGYQWLFIVCGLITLPVSIYGFFVFPDTPYKTSASYFTKDERELAISRISDESKDSVFSWKGEDLWPTLRKVLGGWHFWTLGLLGIVSGTLELVSINALFPLWMLYQKTPQGKSVYSVQHINLYPAGISAVAIVSFLVLAFWTDKTSKRHHGVIVMAISALISSGVLLGKNLPVGATFFGYYMSGVALAAQPIIFTWANQILQGNDAGRSFTLAGMNALSYGINTIIALYLFPASHAPSWTSGKIIVVAAAPVALGVAILIRVLELRDQRVKNVDEEVEEKVESEGDEDS